MVERLWQDLRHGARSLRRTPGFTVAAVVTLALGIGANTAIFSLVDAVMLRSLPVDRPEELVALRVGDYSYPVFQRFAQRTDLFTGLLATSGISDATIRRSNGQSESAQISFVSGSYFTTLGVGALAGRALTTDDDRLGRPQPVAMLSHGYWQRRFAADPSVVGQQIIVNKAPLTIVGIAPGTFFGEQVGAAPDLWIPLTMWSQVIPGRDLLNSAGTAWLGIIGRIKPGVNLTRAAASLTLDFRQTLLEIFGNRIAPDARRDFERATVSLEPAARGISAFRREFGRPLQLLMAAVALVLLIACANVANLLLIRAVAMRRDIAVRLALGVSRARLFRERLTESALLAALGTAAGLAIGWWAKSGLLQLMSVNAAPLPVHITLDARLLLFVTIVAAGTVILFGVAPAWQSARVDTVAAFKGAPVSGHQRRSGPASLLVVGQVATSIVLLVGAGLVVRTLLNLRGADLGFARERLLIVDVDPRAAGYLGARYRALASRLLARLEAVPGVQSVTLTENGVLTGRDSSTNRMRPVDMTDDSDRLQQERFDPVGPRYFRTMGIPLVAGRDFSEADEASSARVIVINQALARYYFGDASAIGRRMLWRDTRAREVVGVAADVKPRGPRDEIRLRFYLPYQQLPAAELSSIRFAVRTEANPDALAGLLRQSVLAEDSLLPTPTVDTAADLLDRALVQDRAITTLVSVFGALALGIAALGLYATLAYRVVSRRRELGVRAAIGARPADLLALVMREGFLLVAAGTAAGIGGALASSRLVDALLFGVVATDVPTYAAAVAVIFVSAAAACYLPARRAATADPMMSLRTE
ncbi:MAG TPA: ABC transporter permease [Vicinamibacterales bacterium]|nr:ABC transporter permease [Vicinamibacterales bacterium]